MKRMALLLIVLLMFLCTAACAEKMKDTPSILSQGLTLGEHSITYPQLEGMDDETVQERLNQHLRDASHAEELLARLPLVMTSSLPIKLDYHAQWLGEVLSVAFEASGPLKTEQPTQAWYAVCLNTATGERIPLDNILSMDGNALLTDWLEYTFAPQQSAHLMNCQLSPLPDAYTLTADGLTLYYPMDQLTTLSDRAGKVKIHWYEVPDAFDFSEEGVLAQMGADAFLTIGEATAENIAQMVSAGQMVGLPVTVGETLTPLTDRYRLQTEPDLYEGGRLFALEDGIFRNSWLLSDRLTIDTWENSVVQGLRSDNVSLWGIHCRADGVAGTSIEEWRACLGQPEMTVSISQEAADLYRLVPGQSDYYQYGAYRLRLHADEAGQLVSVFVMQ